MVINIENISIDVSTLFIGGSGCGTVNRSYSAQNTNNSLGNLTYFTSSFLEIPSNTFLPGTHEVIVTCLLSNGV